MSGNTEKARKAAKQMLNSNIKSLFNDFVSEGIYNVIIEGGYHYTELNHEESEFLTKILINDGLSGLERYVEQYNADENPPRNEVDMYGEPFAIHTEDDKLWEAYRSGQKTNIIFIVYYSKNDFGEWVKNGLERVYIEDLYQFSD